MSFKIYTRTGDDGTTGLFGGERVSKDDARLEAYGTVDELNSQLGLLRAFVAAAPSRERSIDADVLAEVQHRLFTVGSQLATPVGKSLSVQAIDAADAKRLEDAIDAMDKTLPALTAFILPAGSQVVAQAHVCRTVARRAERRVVTLSKLAPVDEHLRHYLNRLSDYFFVLARALARAEGLQDVPWAARR